MSNLEITSYRLGAFATALAMAASLTASMQPANAQEHHHTVVTPGEAEFQQGPPSLPEGAQIAVLYGNPSEEGPFALRLKFPAGYTVPPHTHPKDEIVTVISGKLGLTAGDMLDQSAAPLLAPGSLVVLPSGMAHFAWVEEETVIQLNSIGPLEITYLRDGDDPRVN
ncbi:MAG: cupin domain-containing protein [Sulfitobacter sp.]|uniref:cupin domain-containing protein n=1 Tax=Alphaproteobacteria TaxID=28211 RepID=UPI0032638583